MTSFPYQVASGSATVVGDIGMIGVGVVNNAVAVINPTNLAYGFYSVDQAGRVWVAGSNLTSAFYVDGASKGFLAMAVASAVNPTYGASYINGLSMDLSGNLRTIVSGFVGVTSSATTANQGTSPWVVSGNVSATQVTSPWVVSGNVSATQVTSPWVVSGNVTAFPASSTALTADAIGAVSGQTVAAFNYIKSSAGATWDRWAAVAAHATSSGAGASAIGMVAPMYQFDDTSTVAANENFFGVPRMSSTRIAYVTATGVWPVSLATTTAFISGTANVQTITAQAGAPAGVTVSTATGGSVVTILAANASRKGCIITNNSSGKLFLGYTNAVSAAGATMGLLIAPSGTYSDFGFSRSTGAIFGVYNATTAAQNVSVSEWV